jgi:CheY-like chemotaxis protein
VETTGLAHLLQEFARAVDIVAVSIAGETKQRERVRPRVLIVDDAADVRKLLSLMLSGEGIDVVAEAADGAEGAAIASGIDIDVVIMDLRMPIMDGIEATRRIKLSKPNVCVFVFTAVDNPEEESRARAAGADDYLIKGAGALTLSSRILERFEAA